MKLTKSLRWAIAKQFKDHASMEYLATLYGFKLMEIEAVIRRAMIEGDEKEKGDASRVDN